MFSFLTPFGFKYICKRIDIFTGMYSGYWIHENEKIQGPDTDTLNTFIFDVLKHKVSQNVLNNLNKLLDLQTNRDIIALIHFLNNKQQVTKSEQSFLKQIPHVFRFKSVEYKKRCVVSCKDFLNL